MSLVSRFDRTVAYLRSVFDEPHSPGKASMARVCAAGALVAAIWTVRELVKFANAKPDSVGMAGILSGAATMLAATVCLGLLLRKGPTGATETDDAGPTAPSVVSPVIPASPPSPPPAGPQI